MICLSAYDLTAAPPTTEVAVIKSRSGHQKGVKVAQAASDQEDCNVRLEDSVLEVKQALQGVQEDIRALKGLTDHMEVMLMALCLHLGITPSLLPGLKTAAAPSESSIRSILAAPVSGSTARSLVPKYAGVSRNAGDEDPSREVQGLA